MHQPPATIAAVLDSHQVLSLAVSLDDIPWAASAFFAYDPEQQRLLFLSSLETRHGELLALNPRVAGTITSQFTEIAQIHGLQFYGIARRLAAPHEAEDACALYYTRFPQARGFTAPVWEIRLLQLKLTDNRLGFGTKIQWSRHDGETSPVLRCTASDTTTTTSL